MRLSDFAASVAQLTRAAARDYCAEHGRERGLALFARRVGITERRARSLAEGSAGRIDAAEFLAVQQARAELIRARLVRDRENLIEIEGSLHGLDASEDAPLAGLVGRAAVVLPAAGGGSGDRCGEPARAAGPLAARRRSARVAA